MIHFTQRTKCHVVKAVNNGVVGDSFGTFGVKGETNSTLNYPWGVANSGYWFVCDHSRVVKLYPNLTYHSEHSTANTIGKPYAIMYDDITNDLYVVGMGAGEPPSSTSITSLTVGLGSQSLVIQTSLSYSVGQNIIIEYFNNPSINMQGMITSYNPINGQLVVNVLSINGSGTYSSWSVYLPDHSGPFIRIERLTTNLVSVKVSGNLNNIQTAWFRPTGICRGFASNSFIVSGAARVVSSPTYATSSTTSSSTHLTIGTGSQSLVIGTGLAFSAGQNIIIKYDVSNNMQGTITSYNHINGNLVVNVTSTNGSGTHFPWTVYLPNVRPINGGYAVGSLFQTIESTNFSVFTTQTVIGELPTWPNEFMNTAFNAIVKHPNGYIFVNNGRKILRVNSSFVNEGDTDIIAKTIRCLKVSNVGDIHDPRYQSLLIYNADTQTISRYSANLNFIENVFHGTGDTLQTSAYDVTDIVEIS